MIDFEIDTEKKKQQTGMIATLKVVGVGGAGGNTVNSIIASGNAGIDFIAANTDAQALELSQAETKVQIGIKSTKGLGTGADPELGKRAAEEDLDKIMEAIGDADVVFLAGGMGGGTGSGGLPVVARALRDKGILSIAIVTKPFLFEGKRRSVVAEQTLNELRKEVDTLLVVPNQNLIDLVDQNVSMIDAFAMVNDLLCQSVKGISDIITRPGHINVDFSDVRTIMKDMGLAVMGTGRAAGADRAQEAALQAISSPLLENMSVEGAHGVLLNISGGTDLSLHEISRAASVVYDQAHEDANIILGSVIDESLQDEITVTIIATGFDPAGVTSHTAAQKAEDASVEQVSAACAGAAAEQEACSAQKVAESAAEPEKAAEEHKAAQESADTANTVQEPEANKTGSSLVDMNDLDVPTFLREKGSSAQE